MEGLDLTSRALESKLQQWLGGLPEVINLVSRRDFQSEVHFLTTMADTCDVVAHPAWIALTAGGKSSGKQSTMVNWSLRRGNMATYKQHTYRESASLQW
jgi:hypothetical protein